MESDAGKVRQGIESALRQQASGSVLPFATVEKASGQVVGGTRFRHIVPEHRCLEIGSTWIARAWRRTAINTEAKLLMLEFAFERLGCVRVEFMADALNETSRKAILRIGAKEEGLFRNYIIMADGEIHDTVFYSIIESEWPSVKGYIYALTAPQHVVANLDRYSSEGKQTYPVYRHIEGNWFLYIEAD